MLGRLSFRSVRSLPFSRSVSTRQVLSFIPSSRNNIKPAITRPTHLQSGNLCSKRTLSTMAPTTDVNFGNYEQLTEFKLAYAPVTVAKYRSTKTGFSVVVANNKAPITNAYFTVATEIFDDTGRPHTLEHLVFLGSKSYPYKGVLDNLANRAGGDGTNAWTADDREA